ncbi:MAG: type II toxin-antitoxin system ParD family antitoxin [Rhizobiaceae bacterium]|nr:type II toxin-antitoxin system ParD family antitoxin [Rhizobiaceae bacterium]
MASVEKTTVEPAAYIAGSSIYKAVDACDCASTSEAVRDGNECRNSLDHAVEGLRDLVDDGLASGPSPFQSMDEVKAEARRRLEASGEEIR